MLRDAAAAASPPRWRRRPRGGSGGSSPRGRRTRRREGDGTGELREEEARENEEDEQEEKEEGKEATCRTVSATAEAAAKTPGREPRAALSTGFWDAVAAADSDCQQRFPRPLLLVVKSCHAPPAPAGEGSAEAAASAGRTAAAEDRAVAAGKGAHAGTGAPEATAAGAGGGRGPTAAATAATEAAASAATAAGRGGEGPSAATAAAPPRGEVRKGVTQLVFATDGSRAGDGAFYVGRVYLRRGNFQNFLFSLVELGGYTISSLKGQRCVLAAAVREFPRSCLGVDAEGTAAAAEKFVMHPGLLCCPSPSSENGLRQQRKPTTTTSSSSRHPQAAAAASPPRPSPASPAPVGSSPTAAGVTPLSATAAAAPASPGAAVAVSPAAAAEASAAVLAAAPAAASAAAGDAKKTKRKRQKQTVYDSRGSAPVVRQKGGVLVAIRDINAYSQNWVIRGRVTDKGDVRHFANQRGEGQLFSISVVDTSETEIRATFFGSLVEVWHSRLHVGRIYEFSGGTVSLASRQFNTLPHQFEIKFGENTNIREADEDADAPIPLQLLKPLEIAEILQKEAGSIVDVVGIVSSFSDTHTVSSKHVLRQELRRKELTLVDQSQSINLTLWENFASDFRDDEIARVPLLAIKGARVSEYAGLTSLSSTPRGRLYIGREVEAAGISNGKQLLDWWQQQGKRMHRAAGLAASVTGLTPLATVAAATRSLEAGNLYFNCHVVIAAIEKRAFLWLACPDCRRKVRRDFSRPPEKPSAAAAPSYYRCLRCSKAVDPLPQWALSLTFADPTGSMNSVALDEHAQQLVEPLQVTAQSAQMLEAGGTDTFGRVLSDFFDLLLYRELKVRLCLKRSAYMGEDRVTCRVVGCTWLEKDLETHTRTLLREVEDYADRL